MIEQKIDSALLTIQGVLTGLVVSVGIVVSLYIIVTSMHKLKNPQEKDEVFRSIGRVMGAVALGAAIIWVAPWVYNLFT
ncbi:MULTISPECIES: CagC family type IV secretion system protein [Halobacillus]|uniref:CagC family type IV secretion system protein n=1 Tax=Halobacillus TaxID=45667 RepID=UPI0009A89467|nr:MULTISPECIES: CagC family type IV secretion system protein [Halobacillus]